MSEENTQEAAPEAPLPPPAAPEKEASPKPNADTMTPGAMVTLPVYNHAGAGKTINTRWGAVEFDKDGMGEVSLKSEDITLLDQLQWLLPEDRAKYLGVAVRVQKAVASDNAAEETNAKMAALIAENAKLTNDNEKGRAQLDELVKRIEVLEEAEKGFDAKIKVLTEENASLKTSLAEGKKSSKKGSKA